MKLLKGEVLESLARVNNTNSKPFCVGLVQTKWHENAEEHLSILEDGIKTATESGARVVFLQELTLSRYPADKKPEEGKADATAESLEDGPTFTFISRMAKQYSVAVHASLFEKATGEDGLGHNTAILVNKEGQLIGRTRKLHIPKTEGYFEDKYFRPGPANDEAYKVFHLVDSESQIAVGLPTCWDQWFPEVARAYSINGAQLIVYPTAIGSEPDHPQFNTQPLWEKVIVANGIANGTFMLAVNRWGNEGLVSFYGSSFISDPYGRVLVKAPREGDFALVADIDLPQRRDWLDLFPFLSTRRPDTYSVLTQPKNE